MSDQENLDAARSYDAYNNQGSLKEFWATPLKLKRNGQGATEVYVHLGNTTMSFELPNGQSAIDRVGNKVKYGWLNLSTDNEVTNLVQQDKLWMSHIKIKLNNPLNKRTLTKESGSVYMEIHPSLAALNLKTNGSTLLLPDKKIEEFKLVMVKRINKNKFLCDRSPIGEYCTPSVPKSGTLKDWYLDTLETSPQKNRVNSLQHEFQLLKRSAMKTGNVFKKIDNVKEGHKSWGMLEQKSESVLSIRDDEGNEIKSLSKVFDKDNVRIQEHRKLDFTKVKYKGRRFNEMLRQLPSNSIHPIRQWVDAVGDVEEWSIGIIASLISIVNITDDLKLPKGS
jgi:hypothetical protein